MKHLLLILLPLVVACGCDKDDGRYAVGDIYKHNGKTGIVVSVSKNGLHGKIVSTDYVECQWSVEEEELIVTGAVDWDNGKNNMKVIRSIDGWGISIRHSHGVPIRAKTGTCRHSTSCWW